MVDQTVRVFSWENALGENCTSSSDCDYSHGRCVKNYDQCEMGLCGCDYGYRVSDRIEGSYLCQKLRRIGDRCNVIEDKCYNGTCKGVCTCGRDQHASDDREHCVDNTYNQPCNTKTFNNYNWKTYACEANKGLRCDGDTSKCLCNYGMKHIGDHCEYYRIGETCDHTAAKASDRKQCEVHLLCNADKKCACSDTTKEHTFKVRDDGVEKEMRRCVDKEAKLNVAESAACNADYRTAYTKDKADVCGDFHVCDTCFEWANEYSNNTKCLSGGADSQRTNAAVSVGLVLVAFFAMLR
ncbi:hypothetical protein LSAT2_003460 [Lamellibrachia satsuma]|nr:hypothetical protein LSAT2_003460 [Lamellibrachia satsuma]